MELDQLNEIDWEHVFNDLPPSSMEQDSAAVNANQTVESWIEELLMKDDDEEQQAALALENDFMWSDLLLDSPRVDCQPSDDKSSPSCSNSELNANRATNYDYGNTITNSGEDTTNIPNFESNGENDKSGDDALELDDTDDDPLSKKRKRQLRNRDAALRSRERKKMYVKDLEMKSQYMEAECRRLGKLLQCCYAENQMLRISLGNAYGASMAKPESAVLLLESLLLVSLVWLMVNICLPSVPKLLLLNQDAVPHGSVERKNLESATQNGKGTKVIELSVTFSFMRSKRCKASRIKMKSDFDTAVLCA
ncbi:bZIP transcription factor 50 [Bienertia sinuspersici]